MKKILIVTDVLLEAQVNGVGVNIINRTRELQRSGYHVELLDATRFKHTFALPSYPEIRLVLATKTEVKKRILEASPDFIHVETEGTLGFLVRAVCTQQAWNFTTSYHTRFPEYVKVRTKSIFLENLTYSYLRWFHRVSKTVMVSTESMREELLQRKFARVAVVPLGVDLTLFTRNKEVTQMPGLVSPVFVYFGRVAIEKNIEDFLQLDVPGTKLVIGDGPARAKLETQYKGKALFVGYKKGKELVDLLSMADVEVFPSMTDTFGLTIIEGLACGLPVAAYDVQGPNNILTDGVDGYFRKSLKENALACTDLSRDACRATAEKYSWKESTKRFESELSPR